MRLAGGLGVFGIPVAHPDDAPDPISSVDARAVDHVEAERHHIAASGGHRHGVLDVPIRRRQMRRTRRAVGVGDHVLPGAGAVRAVQEPYAAVRVVGVVQMYEAVHVAAVRVLVEGPVLVQRERVAGLRGFGVQRGVMQFDVRPDEIGDGTRQPVDW